MKNIAYNHTAAFSNPATTGSKKPGAPKAADRVEPVFGEVRTDIAIPAAARRGVKSELIKKLEALPLNGSVGIANKTKTQVSSTVSKLNNSNENMRQVKDANGAVVMEGQTPINDAAGNPVGMTPGTPKMERIKEWQAHECDPKKDPDKATVRIFRIK